MESNLSKEEELMNSIDGIMYEYSKHKNRLHATKAIVKIIQKEMVMS